MLERKPGARGAGGVRTQAHVFFVKLFLLVRVQAWGNEPGHGEARFIHLLVVIRPPNYLYLLMRLIRPSQG